MTHQIPGPYAWPIIGNMFDVKSEEGISKALDNLADIYGPIFQITLNGQPLNIIASAELLKQVTDERYFVKLPPPALDTGTGPRGLFLARNDDPDWLQAHRILGPAFGVLPVQDMFTGMKDIAAQLCLKWARMGEEQKVLLTEDFTRLTLDTIGLCAMDYRFNSFYSEKMHPFVEAMVEFLKFSGDRNTSPWIYRVLTGKADEVKNEQHARTMTSTAQSVIDYRRQHPSSRHDLLNTMLYGKEPQSGETMRDELIGANMIAFLVAGHETTSGLLSFAFMQLLKHPEAYLKAQEEVDIVVGEASIEVKHLSKLPFLNAVLRETLRLSPTAPGLTKTVHPNHRNHPLFFCDGKYIIDPDVPIRVLLGKCMTDPTYFGDNARDFVPERMLETNPDFNHFIEAWNPFGNGSRSCIGQNFAWQEALLALTMILQNFELNLVDGKYVPRVVQTLTVKPKDLFVKARLRPGLSPTLLAERLSGGRISESLSYVNETSAPSKSQAKSTTTLTILYGSNTGTCQSLAQRLGSAAAAKYGAQTYVCSLDEATEKSLLKGSVIIVTASYEGQPPDNAGRFVAWLTSCNENELDGIAFSVFGCGHKDWHRTLFAIPKLIDETMEARGAHRLHRLGTSDVSECSVVDDFSAWQSRLLKTIFGDDSDAEHRPHATQLAEITSFQRTKRLDPCAVVAKVTNVTQLTADGVPEKRELTVELPEDLTYSCGDYLGVLPVNPDHLVRRVMAHWNLTWDASIVLKSKAYGNLPLQQPLSIFELLRNEFEIQKPAAQSELKALLNHTEDEETKKQFEQIISADKNNADRSRLSIFQCLVKVPGIKMDFAEYLTYLFPLRIRQYSISSSPLVQPRSCSITYSVVHAEVPRPFTGVATNFLASLRPGDNIHVSLKETATARSKCPFRLPSDPTTPILMYCAGTGLAPFRGFLQQRAFMVETNPATKLAPALLFVGCRSATSDRLYAKDLDTWSELGVVDVRYAFSREPENSFGCKYLSDRMSRDADDVVRLWRQGARAFICGSRGVLETVQRTAQEIFEGSIQEFSAEDREEELKEKRKVFEDEVQLRAVSDVFD